MKKFANHDAAKQQRQANSPDWPMKIGETTEEENWWRTEVTEAREERAENRLT
jgi:hypothetical protein